MPPIEVWAQNNLGLTSPRCTIIYKTTTWPDSTRCNCTLYNCNCTLYSYTWLQCTDPALSGHGWPRGSFPANFQFFPSPTTATSPTRTRHDVANIHNQSSTSPTIGALSKQPKVSPFDKSQGGENTHQQKIEENLLSDLPLVSYVPCPRYTQLWSQHI